MSEDIEYFENRERESMAEKREARRSGERSR